MSSDAQHQIPQRLSLDDVKGDPDVDTGSLKRVTPSPTIVATGDPEKVSNDSGPPDGGFAAWLVVFGCFCASFSTFGFANAFGVFQAYYEGVIPGATQSTIAWIGSLQYCLIFLPGFIAGHLADKGYFKIPLFCASIVLVVSTILVAECKTLWQLVLCQGFAIGGSAGFIFLPSLSVIPQWFDKRRGRAYGIISLGSSTGGTILPIILRHLLTSVGFKWTIRILAFIILAFMIVFNLTVRPRVKIAKADRIPVSVKELFTHKAYMLYTAGITIVWLGLYNCLAFLDVSAQFIGVPASQSFYTLVAANAASGLGRLSSGFLSERYGVFNVFILFSFVSAIMEFAWPFAHSLASLMVVAVIYGAASGAFISMLPAGTSVLIPRHMIGRGIGLGGMFMAIGALVGTPIAGQIFIATGNFNAVGAWAGSTVILAVCFITAARRVALGRWIGKM
ncbi:hypothetical protein FRB94_002097 [Tulasnella sp. JGI-2019a]|nr:hypothetical protein FRB93_012861 [Tulasnella sp. JGI-2019a]KAG9004780.1 hypothetical protein FRB94_002097 [Tulasnella sp. JGI-2019a]KAG9036772.1 hypothetical protein FRB95_007870 [Tulasnella sp. JGI-2019a]